MPLIYDYYLIGDLDVLTLVLFGSLLKTLTLIVVGYSAFAFLTSFAREVI